MRRNLWVIAVVVVGLVLTSSLAYARTVSKPNKPNVGLGQIYDRTNILRVDEGPVRLPRPIGDPNATNSVASMENRTVVNGPIATSLKSPRIGGPMAQPRGGGSIYSGQQQADREIKQLIRRLN